MTTSNETVIDSIITVCTAFISGSVFGQPFVKLFTLCYQTVVSLSVLSVMLVYCGQTVGWIKMKLGMQLGLGPGHIVLDGDPAPLSQLGAEPPNFPPISVVAKWPQSPISATAELLLCHRMCNMCLLYLVALRITA